MPKLFVATKAFIEKDGKILILRESGAYKEGTNAAKYDVVGGRITPGENLEDALRREIAEECDLKVEIGRPFFADESIPRPVVQGEEWQVVKIYFACRAKTGEVKLSEDHDNFEWLDPANFREAGLIPNLYPVFEAYLKYHEI